MKSVLALTLAASALAGCVSAPNSTPNAQTVRMAVVESVHAVTIANHGPGSAIAAPALSDLSARPTNSDASPPAEKTIERSISGGIAGNRVEITVRLDSGELLTITQDADEAFRPGERVSMLSSGRTTRIAH